MDVLLALSLSLAMSRQELRFSPVQEQWGPLACGDAVAATLLGEGHKPTRAEADAALDLGSLASLLSGGGLRVRPLLLDSSSLGEILDRGLYPLIVHYSRPAGHYALLFGRVEDSYALGDPARGFELLPAEDFEGRWSGAAIAMDPAGLPPALMEEASLAIDRAKGRQRLLASEGAGVRLAGPNGADDAAFLLSGRLALPSGQKIFTMPIEISLALRGGPAQFGLALPLEWASGDAGRRLTPGLPGLSAAFFVLGRSWVGSISIDVNRNRFEDPLGPPGSLLGVELSRVLDPVVLGMAVGCVFPGEGRGVAAWRLGVSATEALSERFFIRLETSLRLDGGAGSGGSWLSGNEFGIAFGMGDPIWSASCGMRDYGASRALILDGGLALPARPSP